MELKTALKGVNHPNKNLFEFQELIGLGGFGKVWKVQYKKTKQILALKELSKRIILEENLLELTFKERDILSSLYSPYISNLYCTFQDNENLYIVLDYLPGKDLKFKIQTLKRNFTEEEIKFIAGNVILGLEYIHSKGIIHRDIKPANLVFDNKGYIRISDFGIAVYYSNKDIPPAGTPGYFAPESIMNRYKFFYSVDYFNLGIILYEIVKKEKPFKSTTVSNLIEEFSSVEINLSTKDLNNSNYSEKLCDFINKMLVINPKDRIGSNNNIDEIKNHPFFSDLNWKHLYHKTIRSPFKNDNIENKKKIENINYNEEPLDKELQEKFLDFTILHQIDFSNPLTYNSNLINKSQRKSKSNLNDNFPKKKITPLKITNLNLKNDIISINSNNEINNELHLPLITTPNIYKNNSFRKKNYSSRHSSSLYESNEEPISQIKQSKTLRKTTNFDNSLNKDNKNNKRKSSLFVYSIGKTLKEFNLKKGNKKKK